MTYWVYLYIYQLWRRIGYKEYMLNIRLIEVWKYVRKVLNYNKSLHWVNKFKLLLRKSEEDYVLVYKFDEKKPQL